jgi:hypothetical protein
MNNLQKLLIHKGTLRKISATLCRNLASGGFALKDWQNQVFSEDEMIVPQKLFRHRTQNEISATSSCSALASRSALHGVEICSAWYWRVHANTIFGG